MATLSSVIAWKIPWTEEPGGLQSMGVARVRHDLATKLPNHNSRSQASLIAQLVKNPPAKQENLVRFLGWEDPLEKEMAIHSSIICWRIPWTEDRGAWWATVYRVPKSRT